MPTTGPVETAGPVATAEDRAVLLAVVSGIVKAVVSGIEARAVAIAGPRTAGHAVRAGTVTAIAAQISVADETDLVAIASGRESKS